MESSFSHRTHSARKTRAYLPNRHQIAAEVNKELEREIARVAKAARLVRHLVSSLMMLVLVGMGVVAKAAANASKQGGKNNRTEKKHRKSHNPQMLERKLPQLEGENIREQMVQVASKYLGRRYRAGAKGPKAFDCSGFTSFILRQAGIGLAACSQAQALQGETVSIDSAKPGDLVFFSRTSRPSKKRKARATRIYHAALVYSNTDGRLVVIHSASHQGVVLTSCSAGGYWQQHLHSARNVLGSKAVTLGPAQASAAIM